MFNKIYEIIKKFIKENYKDIIIFAILLFTLTYKLPYYIYVGGGTIDLNDRISLESNEKGSYNLAYVKEINATIPMYLLSKVINKWELVSTDNYTVDDSESTDDVLEREKLYLEEANNNAILNAYKLAGKDITINDSYYKVIYVYKESDTNIEIGDRLVSVDNVKIDDTLKYKEYLKDKNAGDKVVVKVLRDSKEVECYAKIILRDNEKIIGLYLVNVMDYDINPEIELKFKWNESGPSGGFMTSLAIYDRLIDEDLTKGRKIVGTGTIDSNGNVGEIGGVKYKLMGAVSDKADIFFVPNANYEEAMKVKNAYKYDIKVIKVDTLEEAVKYLKEN